MSAAESITLRATAKVNLYLHVTGKRADGYHLLDSLVAFPAGIYDPITIGPSDHFSLTIDGPFAKTLSSHDNLIVKATQVLSSYIDRAPNVHVHLTKNIPLGSGLGGGSADAAATIKGLEKFWDLHLSDEVRQKILLQLGADVPVCYADRPCRFQGIGEQISDPIKLPPLFMLLIWPGKPSFTKDVFAQYKHDSTPVIPASLASLQNRDDFLAFLSTTENSLQESAELLCPDIRDAHNFIKSREGCLFRRMTGSGATVFGLFDSKESCISAQKEAEQMHPAWWSRFSAL